MSNLSQKFHTLIKPKTRHVLCTFSTYSLSHNVTSLISIALSLFRAPIYFWLYTQNSRLLFHSSQRALQKSRLNFKSHLINWYLNLPSSWPMVHSPGPKKYSSAFERTQHPKLFLAHSPSKTRPHISASSQKNTHLHNAKFLILRNEHNDPAYLNYKLQTLDE